MFAGREAELKFLDSHYKKESSQILVLYGRKGLGKTTLLKHFVQDKDFFYYMGRPCSSREQYFQWGQEIKGAGAVLPPYPDLEELLTASLSRAELTHSKKILILDEFQYFVKADETFMSNLIQYAKNPKNAGPLLVILCSSATGWVENSMVSKIGRAALAFSGLWKVRELKYQEMRRLFPEYSDRDFLTNISVLGGNPGLWKYFSADLSPAENIQRTILDVSGRLREEVPIWLSEELREPAVYQTILAGLASGKHKLNELHVHTGFSRAKISVYLKNLMELDLVEKVSSLGDNGKGHVQKGIYRISHSLVQFYFQYLFANQTDLELLDAVPFYDKHIRDSLWQFEEAAYRKLCAENLSDHYDKLGEWIGKDGVLPILGETKNGERIVCQCLYHRAPDLSEHRDFMKNLRLSGWKPNKIIYFCEHLPSTEVCRKLGKDQIQMVSIFLQE